MKWVGSFRTRPGINKLVCGFHPNDIFEYLRNKISFFYSLLLIGLVSLSNDLLGQQADFTFDTIRFEREKFVGIGDYYSNSRITKGAFHSNLFKVSTDLYYLKKQNTTKDGLNSVIGLGDDLSNRANWLLEEGISKEEMSFKFKIELYCRGMQTRTITANSIDKDHIVWIEQPETMLDWRKGASGYIWERGKLFGEIQTVLGSGMYDSNNWIKRVYNLDNSSEMKIPESRKDFAIWCSFLNEEITIIYSSIKDRMYLFSGNNLVGLYHPEKWKFLVKKGRSENPFLLVEENLDESERISLLVLSMFSQWFMNVIYLY